MAAIAAGVGGSGGNNGPDRWYFSQEELALTSASRACGLEPDKELSQRQQTANLIQEMGQRLHVNQLCINTAIVYMHRFYRFHSFTKFNRNDIAQCALFLAAKVEEQPRKLEHVIKCARATLNKGAPPLDPQSEEYQALAGELVANENLMLQTLGFDIGIDHPHTHVVKCCQLVKASKELAQTSYFLATNSLHFTTMCLQYKPTVVACLCIFMACKWASWQIPQSSEGKDWFNYIDETVTEQLLEDLMAEFVECLNKCPEKTRNRIMGCIKSKDQQAIASASGSHRSSSGTHSSGGGNQGERTHQQGSHHQGSGSQRLLDSLGRSRQHPSSSSSHQPDSTTLLADRRKTLPPSNHQLSSGTQGVQQVGPQRSSGQHHGHPQTQDRYSYNKEHQRQQQGGQQTAQQQHQLGHPSAALAGRHSLPTGTSGPLGSNKAPSRGMTSSSSSSSMSMQLHPKKQYTQQQQQQQQHYVDKAAALQRSSNDKRGVNVVGGGGSNGQPPPPQLVDQSRREQMHIMQQQQHSMMQLHGGPHASADKMSAGQQLQHPHPPRLEVKTQQHMQPGGSGGRNMEKGLPAAALDDTSGLLRPADFSQPYPSCASPPAHNPMFEGDSSSADSFFTGLGNIVSQTSPNNTNSGSNSGFATGSGMSRGDQPRGGGSSSLIPSPPETHHNLSPPESFASAAAAIVASHFSSGALPPLHPSTAPLHQLTTGISNQLPITPTIKPEQQQQQHPQKVEARSPGIVQSTEQQTLPPTLATHPPHQQQPQKLQQGLITAGSSSSSMALLAHLQQSQQQMRGNNGTGLTAETTEALSGNTFVDSLAPMPRSSAPIVGGHRAQGETKHTLGSAPKQLSAPTAIANNNNVASAVVPMQSAPVTACVSASTPIKPIGSSGLGTNAAEGIPTPTAKQGSADEVSVGWSNTAVAVKAELKPTEVRADDDSRVGLAEQTEIDGGKKHKKKKEKKEKKEKRHKDKDKIKEKEHLDRNETTAIGGSGVAITGGGGDGNSKEKKKKKKKDKDRDRDKEHHRENHHRSDNNSSSHRSPRSMSRSPVPGSGSSPLSAAQPQAPVVQVTGTKLKIKLVPPKPTSTVAPLLATGSVGQGTVIPTGAISGGQRSSDSDSNHGSSSMMTSNTTATSATITTNSKGGMSSTGTDNNLRIKIPIDKLDGAGPTTGTRIESGAASAGAGKEKRKRRTEDFEEGPSGGNSKSRKVQHY
ncbi:cyclin-T2-like isoform X2 [Varroa jacobsoni]|uniref:cyclin-T2-like isoform X2 n=1 Tax=Varroa jacobsoni TaxID=62625 RepID=UPI000BF6F57C|nr:cyclin-T2-like isoform X2 [Varroa jacobsoni]